MRFTSRFLGTAAIAAGALLGLAAAPGAQAGVSWSVGVGVPGVQLAVAGPQRVLYAQPGVVYAQPAPVYVQPQATYYAQPVYPPAAYPPVVYAPAPVYRPGWGYGHHHHHHGYGGAPWGYR